MSMDLPPEFGSNAGMHGYTDSTAEEMQRRTNKASSGATAIGRYAAGAAIVCSVLPMPSTDLNYMLSLQR